MIFLYFFRKRLQKYEEEKFEQLEKVILEKGNEKSNLNKRGYNLPNFKTKKNIKSKMLSSRTAGKFDSFQIITRNK